MAGGKFSLPDEEGGEGEQLTHLGRSLAELEDVGEVSRGISCCSCGRSHLQQRGRDLVRWPPLPVWFAKGAAV